MPKISTLQNTVSTKNHKFFQKYFKRKYVNEQFAILKFSMLSNACKIKMGSRFVFNIPCDNKK